MAAKTRAGARGTFIGADTGRMPVPRLKWGWVVDDVSRLVLEAWERLGPAIKADREELARRLARRRMAILQRPPRAWCIALRASDRRITPAHWIIFPEHALEVGHEEHPYEPIEHEVTIDARVLRKFCRHVRTDSWGEELDEVCRKLGTTPEVLYGVRRRSGKFTERRIKGLGGKRRASVPLIHSWESLDPGGTSYFTRPDKLWGSLWEHLPDMVPDDFQQEVMRRPTFRKKAGKGGVVAPDDHLYREDLRFAGWMWICPGCRNEVRKIYYPLPAPSLFDFFKKDPAPTDADEMSIPPPSFACLACHRIRYGTRTSSETWNYVVSHLTRGLLYGHEVEKPAWYRKERKNRMHRKLGARPAVKRQAVFLRMMNGWTIEQIALDLKLSRMALLKAMSIIFRQEGVKNRRELAAKLGWELRQPLNGWELTMERGRARAELVEQSLVEGRTYKEIAQATGLKVGGAKIAAAKLYKRRGVCGRKGLIELQRVKSPCQNAAG